MGESSVNGTWFTVFCYLLGGADELMGACLVKEPTDRSGLGSLLMIKSAHGGASMMGTQPITRMSSMEIVVTFANTMATRMCMIYCQARKSSTSASIQQAH